MQDQKIGLDDVLYTSPAGPITPHDVIYGFQAEIEQSSQDFYAHKTGFTPESLAEILFRGGFSQLILRSDNTVGLYAVHALAFKAPPTEAHCTLLEKTWKIRLEELISR